MTGYRMTKPTAAQRWRGLSVDRRYRVEDALEGLMYEAMESQREYKERGDKSRVIGSGERIEEFKCAIAVLREAGKGKKR